MKILAIALGKSKSVGCTYATETGTPAIVESRPRKAKPLCWQGFAQILTSGVNRRQEIEMAGTGREQTPKPPRKTQFPNPALQNAVQLHPTRQTGPKMTLNCVSSSRPGHRSVWNFGWPSSRSCGPAWRHAQIIYKAVYQVAPMLACRKTTGKLTVGYSIGVVGAGRSSTGSLSRRSSMPSQPATAIKSNTTAMLRFI